LKKHGFILDSQRGSHKKFKKDGRIVIMPDPKKEIPKENFCINNKAVWIEQGGVEA
jgi:predicted RNA binding protein YcfA (HicA-like mRNA interferase family)